jgi:hypothetical protein
VTTPAEAAPGLLARALVELAGTPDDSSDVDARLATIVRAAAGMLPGVSYASVTAVRNGADTTVATSSELALAVDEAQYADGSGPCLQSLHDGRPIGVDDIATTMRWPRFRETAFSLGLRASVSVPLFAGSGATVAVLNLYGHDRDAMAPLIADVRAAYDPDSDGGAPDPRPETAGLVSGLLEAFTVRACIQQAIGILIAVRHVPPQDAYLHLRAWAAETGTPLPAVAATVLRQATGGPAR